MLQKKCKICGKVFYKLPRHSVNTWNTVVKYCSAKCQHESLLGRISWNRGEVGSRCAKAHGFGLWMKGRKLSEETKKKIGEAVSNEKHPLWKAEKVSYSGLHYWVSRKLGKPDTCEHCGRSGLKGKQINWANRSHEYRRDLDDWLRLCVPCHRNYDLVEQGK